MKDEPSKTTPATWQEAGKKSGRRCSSLAKSIPKWLEETGPHSNIVISTRIRLARNLKGLPFSNLATNEDLKRVIDIVYDATLDAENLHRPRFIDLNKITRLDKQVLVERRLASPAFIKQTGPAMLILSKGEYQSVMVNEEDHLRLQSFQTGLRISEVWKAISSLDDELSEQIEFAFTDQFGYLTACPTNTGTGMRVSVFIHLPALTMLDEMEETIHEFSSSSIAIRGFYGEGSEVIGNIYQLSNQLTLGRTETAILKLLDDVAHKFLNLELDARERLIEKKRQKTEDRIWRAYGTLKYARVLNVVEFLNLLSIIRLGYDLEILDKNPATLTLLNELMLITQPGHIQKTYKHARTAQKRDSLRAQLVREKLSLQS